MSRSTLPSTAAAVTDFGGAIALIAQDSTPGGADCGRVRTRMAPGRKTAPAMSASHARFHAGRAERRLPPGRDTLSVSGDRQFAFRRPLDLEGDVEPGAEPGRDREFMPGERWS